MSARLLLLALILASSTQSAPQRFEYSEMAMGVRARIVLYATDETRAQDAARAAYDRIAYLEQVMSDYRTDSELMRLCAQAGGPPVRVSPELYYILRKSQDLSRRSDGAFDVTVGPLVRLWRTARKSGKLPAQRDINAARKLVGWQKVSIDPKARAVRLEVPGMQLDLGGIAKGYACDEAIRILKRHGITSALVEMGGDIVVSGPPPGVQGWHINVGGDSSRRLLLSDCAVSSSGDTEQFVEIGGKRYSHVVDPKTGVGLTDRIAVTVIAPTGALSDGLSTAASVLGAQKGRALIRQFPRTEAFIRQAM